MTRSLRLPNRLFDLQLEPADILVFAGLKLLDRNEDGKVCARGRDIAGVCGLHRNTVLRALTRLRKSGLIRTVRRYSKQGRLAANCFYLAGAQRRYFLLEAGLLKRDLPPSAFAVYTYLTRCANHAGRAFPSIRRTARHTSLCRDTVIAAVRSLEVLGLLTKQQYLRKAGNYGCNNFFLRGNQDKKKIECGPCGGPHSISNKINIKKNCYYIFILPTARRFVNTFFSFFRFVLKSRSRPPFFKPGGSRKKVQLIKPT